MLAPFFGYLRDILWGVCSLVVLLHFSNVLVLQWRLFSYGVCSLLCGDCFLVSSARSLFRIAPHSLPFVHF